MNSQQSVQACLLEKLRTHLQSNRYSGSVQQRYVMVARRFLAYVARRNIVVEAVSPEDVQRFVRRELQWYARRHGRQPRHHQIWRWHRSRPVHMLLEIACGQWPVRQAPASAREKFQQDLVAEYDRWMHELRGLAAETRSERTEQALWFLAALGSRGDPSDLKMLTVAEVDSYIRRRFVDLRRRSLQDYTSNLRIFLRYLHYSGHTASDLGEMLIRPKIYAYEDIPSALNTADVEKVLEVTRHNRSPSGRRDYAILTLLATYGLRAGEIVALRLEDIDWRKEVLHVRHSKTGEHSDLPLLRTPGEAMLSYLQKGRPSSECREVFLRIHAPYFPLRPTSLYDVVGCRLASASVIPPGKRGPHAFRHARAVGLLRASVSLKTIGDILGHRSADSVKAYLKLATEDLRAVGLEIPVGAAP